MPVAGEIRNGAHKTVCSQFVKLRTHAMHPCTAHRPAAYRSAAHSSPGGAAAVLTRARGRAPHAPAHRAAGCAAAPAWPPHAPRPLSAGAVGASSVCRCTGKQQVCPWQQPTCRVQTCHAHLSTKPLLTSTNASASAPSSTPTLPILFRMAAACTAACASALGKRQGGATRVGLAARLDGNSVQETATMLLAR